MDGESVVWEEVAEGGDIDADFVAALRLIERLGRAHREAADRPAPSPEVGGTKRWGHLEVLEHLGSGGYGQVFRARDVSLNREVALKILDRPSLREGQLLAQIDHPNVVKIFGSETRDHKVGLWMELIAGRNLTEIVTTDGPFRAREAALIGIEVCRALAAVHSAGILHRDVKAQNVMRELGGRIVLTDFGIGQLAVEERDLRVLSGTPVYLAPEVLHGGPASPRSEVYSLGVLLFFLVTGRFPIEADSFADLLARHEVGTRNLLHDLRPNLPDRFAEIVQRALAPDPQARFKTIGQLQQALTGLLAQTDEVEVRKPLLGVRGALPVAATLLVVALGLLGWLVRSGPRLPAGRESPVRLAAGASDVATGPCVEAPGGMVSWWSGDGDAADILGGNDGAVEAGVTFGSGVVGKAFDFSWGIVRVRNRPDLELQALTVEAWVSARSLGDAPDSIGPIIVAMDLRRRYPTISYTLAGPGTNGNFRASVGLTDGTDPAVVSRSTFPLNTFHHVAMTWDGSDLRLYVNGESEGELSLGDTTVIYEGMDLGIGAHPLFPNRRFDGFIDEVAIYDRALSAAAIASIYNAHLSGKCKPPAPDLAVSETASASP